MKIRVLLLPLLLAACHGAPDADDAPAAAELAPAEPMSVALSREQAARLGIESVALAAAPAGTAVGAFARVVDPQPLFQGLSDRAVAQAALRASDANLQRLIGLFAHDGNASLQELEAARATRAQDAARLQSAQRQLQVQWGGPLAAAGGDALAARLAAGESALVRIEADRTLVDGSVPLAAHWLREGDGALDIGTLWVAPSRDPGASGPTYLGLIDPARGLRPGSTGSVILDLPGAGGNGVLVPRDALVYAQAAPWAYVETAPGHWQRRALDLSQVRADGYVQRSGFAIGERVVIKGAGGLLAAELGNAAAEEQD